MREVLVSFVIGFCKQITKREVHYAKRPRLILSEAYLV